LHAEKLEAKIQLLEKQRGEDREKLLRLDQLHKEKERYEGLVQKLQTKCQTFHSENAELKSQIKSIEAEIERLSKVEQEHDTILELATIDREMAEEKAEAAENESELLRQRLEECELELDILRSEADIYSADMTEEEQEKAGYLSLQRENERAKEALWKLHDLTKAIEREDKERIAELEKDLSGYDRIRQENGDLHARIEAQELTIQDLRQQLDAAESFEDIIEDLSDQNQQFRDQLAEKDQTIVDLQNLKEINDELELHHIEQENDLRAELELKEAELQTQHNRIEEQEAAIEDQDNLLSKFRDLVSDLQMKMTTVESSKILSEEQAKDVTSRFHEVMDLNRRLRHATTASTVKTIEMELQRLSSEQLKEENGILHLFFTEEVPDMDPHQSDPVRAYFRFKRIEFKAELVRGLVASLNPEEDSPMQGLLKSESIWTLEEIKFTMKELWRGVSVCTPDVLARFGPSYAESEPIERIMDYVLNCFRVDEFKYDEIASQLQRCNGAAMDIAHHHVSVTEERQEYKPVHHVSLIKSSLDHITSIYDFLLAYVQKLDLFDDGTEGDGEDLLHIMSDDMEVYKEGAVNTGKLLRVLDTLLSDSLYPDELDPAFANLPIHSTWLRSRAINIRSLARDFITYMTTTYKEHTGPIPSMDVANHYSNLVESIKEPEDLDEDLGGLGRAIAVRAKIWHDKASDLMNCVEVERGPAPWVRRAEELQTTKKQNADAEERLQRLTTEYHSIILQIKEREDIIETKELEIEHLRAKHREAALKAEELHTTRELVDRAEQDKRRLLEEIRSYKVEIQQLKENIAHPQPQEVEDNEVPIPHVSQDPVLDESYNVRKGGFSIFLQAMRDENHWLRQKNNKSMFDVTIGNVLKNVRERRLRTERISQRRIQRADKALDMAFRLETLQPLTPKLAKVEQLSKDELLSPSFISSTPIYARKRAPIKLAPLKTALKWIPRAEMPKENFGLLEEDEFEDLSPIEAEFPDDFEKECMDFSMLGDVSLDAIVRKTVW
jgi:dynactin 1